MKNLNIGHYSLLVGAGAVAAAAWIGCSTDVQLTATTTTFKNSVETTSPTPLTTLTPITPIDAPSAPSAPPAPPLP